MEAFKEVLIPKSFNRLSYVAVIGWIVCGVALLSVFANLENSEPRFSCSEKSENIDLVPEKCLQQYEKRYNKYGFPLYAFVILNFLLILIVCAVYSQVVKANVDQLLEAQRDAEGQRSPGTRRLFAAYCCQLTVRFALGIVFIVLQTQLFYPSNFPSEFACKLTLSGANASDNTTLYQCHNQQAEKKTSWMDAVTYVNSVFMLIVLTELFWIFSRVKKDRRFMKDLRFFSEHLIRANKVRPQQELASFVEIMKQKVKEKTEKPTDLKALFTTKPGEGQRNEDLSIDQIYTHLRFHPNRAEYDFSGNREEQLRVYPEPKRREDDLQPKGPEDILDAENKTVLIVGRPGIGKTLFCTKFVRDWAMGSGVFNKAENVEREYRAVFLVKLRKFNSIDSLSLRELLARSEYSQTENLPEVVWNYIRENPDKFLMLLDGLDEFKDVQGIVDEAVNNNFDDNIEQKMPLAALFSKIANGKLLSGATVVTTTRPTAVTSLADHLEFNGVFEIVGFSSEQVETYVEKFTNNVAKKLRGAGKKIYEHISSNMNLFSLCYIPVNCFIICSCLLQIILHYTEKGKDLTGAVLPEKFTQIYKIATKLFFFRHNEQYKDKALNRKDIESEFPPEVEEEIFKPLAEVAFNCVKERKLIFGESEVQGLEDCGLLHQLPDDASGPFKHEAQFCFLHLTVQEFLAAKHVVDTMDETQLREFVSDHIKKGEWHVVLQFVAGLLGERKLPINVFTDMLPVETDRPYGSTVWPTRSNKHLALTIMKCLHEYEGTEQGSDNLVVENKLEEIGFNAVDLSRCDVAPSDCTAVMHLLKSVEQISFLNLSQNHIGSLGCVEIGKFFDNGNCQLTELNLSFNNTTDKGVLELCTVIPDSKLTKFNLCCNNITVKGMLELCNVIPNSELTELDLGDNNVADEGVLELCCVLPNSKLTKINLNKNNITDGGVSELCKVLSQSKLTTLNLSSNNITDNGVSELCNVISNSKLTELWLGWNKITDVGVLELCNVIPNSNLTNLNLWSNSITDKGVDYLCDKVLSKLTMLWLGENEAITADGKHRLTNAIGTCFIWY